jgi:hypothetical protein
MISMCKYGNDHPREWNRTYGVSVKTGKLNMDKYFEIYSNGIEVDPRFEFKNKKYTNILPNAVYLNILNEELDFIGKYENLKQDIQYISEKLSKKIVLPSAEKSNHKHYSEYYQEDTIKQVECLYEKDIQKFSYTYDSIK